MNADRSPADAPFIAVVGPGDADAHVVEDAEVVGRELAGAGAVVVCGGLGGVMEAACRGARSAGGVTVGLLPGVERAAANAFVTVPIATGLGELRNGLVVRTADAMVAVGKGYGTLSEIALALKLGRPVVGVGTWDIAPGVVTMPDAAAATRTVLRFVAEMSQS